MIASPTLRVVTAVVFSALLLAGARDAATQLTADDVELVIRTAARATDDTRAVIAVVDREGVPLGVFVKSGGSAASADLAVGLARTGAFFSNDEAPLSSRTVRFISGRNFIPGVANSGMADLWDIENTNRGCTLSRNFNPGKAVRPARRLNGGPGLGIVTGKADLLDSQPLAVNPGGVPIFKNGRLVGGVGVAGVPAAQAEFAAFRGSLGSVEGPAAAGFGFGPAPFPGKVVLEGVDLPFVKQTTPPGPFGEFVGTFLVLPQAGGLPPDGYLVGPHGSAELSAAEVDQIISQSRASAAQTRAAIRLPQGRPTRMVHAVAGLDGTILGLFRDPDSTVFSIDVAATKARNVIYFSSTRLDPRDLPGVPPGTAVTNRTIGFGAQPFYPPGIDLAGGPGPFIDLLRFNAANVCTQGHDPLFRSNQSGVVFFPGAAPLYKGRRLVGGLGISGDGVSQDDVVTEGGTTGFEAPEDIRADRLVLRGVRLPYFKFIRNPTR